MGVKYLRHKIDISTKMGSIQLKTITKEYFCDCIWLKSLSATRISFHLSPQSKLNLGLKPIEVEKAATSYMKRIETAIGSDTFEEVFAKRGDATLMFVVDVTGSMKDEILAAKAIAKTIIQETREFDVDYILSPFGDPSKLFSSSLS